MRAVDTNVIVRLITRDDERQASAAEAYIAKGGAWISHLVLVEVSWVLESIYEFGRADLAKALGLLLETEHLAVEEPEVILAALTLFRKGGGRDFADCMIVESARKAGHSPVGTLDKKLARVPGAESV